jgi:5'-nucleotidase (lipoprotein e(P4) family)
MFFSIGFQSVIAQENTAKNTQINTFHPDQKAVVWYQQSAELQALYYQAYQLATLRLEQIKETSKSGKWAVVLDLDETVLDNSPYQAAVITRGVVFPEGWSEWVNLAQAEILPGAKSFLEKAVELGFEPFYITNRSEKEKVATIKNLKDKKIPFADDAHVITKSTTSDKTLRREKVSETHEIVLLIGDNLGDFDEVFQRKSNSIRKNEVDALKHEFGKRFIIVPNPMYGEWEGASFGFDYKKSLIEKTKLQTDSLRVANWE